ncbi:hypothetical protein [Paenibacillus dauci]|uniref:hypothetical protein n=1 Tax=Paenibacillus dauci TaxID=1567106 RepID=UPI0006197725|nr:hypothetical protein [Paenibacillus dauci]
MYTITINPLVGIGSIQLGMTEMQVQQELQNAPWINNEELFQTFEYDSNNRLKFIEINNPFDSAGFKLLYKDLDLFNTTAEDIVSTIRIHTSFVNNMEAELGYTFFFREIGLSLWRANVMTDAIINSPEFLAEVLPENLEDEKRNLYFATIAVTIPSYYD